MVGAIDWKSFQRCTNKLDKESYNIPRKFLVGLLVRVCIDCWIFSNWKSQYLLYLPKRRNQSLKLELLYARPRQVLVA